jgi:hypothetical protein
MPIIGPKTAAELRIFVEHPEPPMAEISWIENQIGLLSIKPKRRSSVMEEKMLIDVFVDVLQEIPRLDLGYAFGRLIRENKWFPDVSEIVELANISRGKRNYKRSRAKALIMKHEQQWLDEKTAADWVKPEEVAKLVKSLSAASRDREDG